MLLRNFWQAPGIATLPVAFERFNPTSGADAVRAWLAPLARGATVEAVADRVPVAVRELLEESGIKSLLVVPIMVDGSLWGEIGVLDCARARVWTAGEVDVLRTLAELIGAAVRRERYIEEVARANTIIQNSPTVLYRLRGERSFPMIYVSSNVALFGYDPQALMQAPTLHLQNIFHEDRAAVHAVLSDMLAGDAGASTLQFRLVTPSGAIRWVENRYTPVRAPDDSLIEIECILADITDRKNAEEKIALLARVDPLTGVANRATFSDRLQQVFAAARRGAPWFAILYLDLDHFKEINDTLGHSAGDRLLRQVSRRLCHATREVDLVSRLGGDEFAIVQVSVSDPEAAGRLAQKVIDSLSRPYEMDGSWAHIGVSVGISLYSIDSASPEELLAQADQALYRAKGSGRACYRFHSDQIDSETRAHLTLADDLRHALAHDELEIHYQPQVELATRRIGGMAALLRWNHPVRGTLLPEDVVPIAEKFGIMPQLGRWVLNGACRQLSLWRQEKLQVPVIAINVALAQIRMGQEFVRDVADSIARWGLSPGDIELDVTEHVLARATLAQSSVLEELRNLGVGIAIDEFGAQYSSLDYLRTYRVNRLKIARGMIAAATAEPGGFAMVRAILSLASELGVQVVVEGVETEQLRNVLMQANAGAQGQGFYFGRAMDANEISGMLRRPKVLPDQ